MSDSRPVADPRRRFVVEETLRAPPAEVYRAWTEGFDRWFAVEGTVSMRAEVGQPFHFETAFDGERHPHYGRFLRLDKDREIELTWLTAATLGAETVVRVEILPSGEGSRVRLTHSGFLDEPSATRHQDAWPTVLRHMDEALAGERRSDSSNPSEGEMSRLPPMTHYVFGILRRPKDLAGIPESEANVIQEGHLAHLRRLREDGRLILSGPLLDDGEARGVLIFRTARPDDVRRWSEDDPAIRHRRLELELHELFAPAGLVVIPPSGTPRG